MLANTWTLATYLITNMLVWQPPPPGWPMFVICLNIFLSGLSPQFKDHVLVANLSHFKRISLVGRVVDFPSIFEAMRKFQDDFQTKYVFPL